LVAGIALGYALAIWVIDTVESQHGEMEAGRRRELIAVIARWRWYWLPPLYGLALLLLLFVTLTRGATAAQFMYNKF
jgi:hypothetical protein